MFTIFPAVIGVTIPGTDCVAKKDIPLDQYLGCIYQFATILAVGLAIVMIIYGGYKYMTSQGNPDTLGEAKEIIVGAIIGLLLLALGYLILSNLGGKIVS